MTRAIKQPMIPAGYVYKNVSLTESEIEEYNRLTRTLNRTEQVSLRADLIGKRDALLSKVCLRNIHAWPVSKKPAKAPANRPKRRKSYSHLIEK